MTVSRLGGVSVPKITNLPAEAEAAKAANLPALTSTTVEKNQDIDVKMLVSEKGQLLFRPSGEAPQADYHDVVQGKVTDNSNKRLVKTNAEAMESLRDLNLLPHIFDKEHLPQLTGLAISLKEARAPDAKIIYKDRPKYAADILWHVYAELTDAARIIGLNECYLSNNPHTLPVVTKQKKQFAEYYTQYQDAKANYRVYREKWHNEYGIKNKFIRAGVSSVISLPLLKFCLTSNVYTALATAAIGTIFYNSKAITRSVSSLWSNPSNKISKCWESIKNLVWENDDIDSFSPTTPHGRRLPSSAFVAGRSDAASLRRRNGTEDQLTPILKRRALNDQLKRGIALKKRFQAEFDYNNDFKFEDATYTDLRDYFHDLQSLSFPKFKFLSPKTPLPNPLTEDWAIEFIAIMKEIYLGDPSSTGISPLEDKIARKTEELRAVQPIARDSVERVRKSAQQLYRNIIRNAQNPTEWVVTERILGFIPKYKEVSRTPWKKDLEAEEREFLDGIHRDIQGTASKASFQGMRVEQLKIKFIKEFQEKANSQRVSYTKDQLAGLTQDFVEYIYQD